MCSPDSITTLLISYAYMLSCFSHVLLFATSWTIAHQILQVRILEWVSMPSSWGSSQPRNQTSISSISYIVSGFFTHWATGKSLICYTSMQNYKFKKEEETSFLSFHCVRIQPEVSYLKIRKRALTRHWIYETWIWNTPASRTVRNINKYLLFQNNNSMKLLADTQHFG